MDSKRYKLLKEKDPRVLSIWEKAVESFPDKNLRNYFSDFDKFIDFYNKMNEWFRGEEVRFIGLFDTYCPELKNIASDTSLQTEYAIEAWSSKAGWV